MSELRVREIGDGAGLARWVDVHNRLSPCWPTDSETERHARRVTPLCAHVLGECHGQAVTVLRIERDPWTPDTDVATLTVGVLAPLRRRGYGSTMVSWATRWATERGFRGLDVWFDTTSTDACDYWSHRGYREVGRERVSSRDTALDPLIASVPGVQIVAFGGREELIDGMYRVQARTIGDVPGPGTYTGQTRDDWIASELEAPGFLPDASTVALVGDEVIGFSLLRRRLAQPAIADHEMTAVEPAWRGHGIARALKSAQIPLARTAGITTLVAMNEERNTAMLRVNARLGYRTETAWVQYRRPDRG